LLELRHLHRDPGSFQTPLLSESTISGATVKLASVSFCYFVGPYNNPSNTVSSVVLNHAWIYEFNEPVTPSYSTGGLLQLGRVTATYSP